MLNKIKKTVNADDFSYFIRYFGLFTLIFSTMTLIIIQVMRSSLYTTVDENLKMLSKDRYSIISLANRTGNGMGRDETADDGPEDDELGPEDGPRPSVTSNSTAILLNDKFENVTTDNGFLDLKTVTFSRSYLNKIKQIQITNHYKQKESYRAYLVDIDPDDYIYGVKYAVIMTNISQLEQTSEKHESQIALVMICFWGISLFASIFLAKMSVKPLLESMNRQKAFVENASHELRTPLAVLQNRLETLFRKPEATIMESSESIASSLEEVRNMRFLTTNLLNLARRDDGIKPELGEVEPDFFNTIFTNYEMIASENNRVFRFENRVHRTIITDKLLLKQLMTILFDNAVKYTEEEGDIYFEISTTERSLYLTVADNGIGISAADKKKIFDRFYRVDKARTRQKGGFGLGLSLAKQIVDALKGSISVKDNKPNGTIFEVKIAISTPSRRKNK